MKQFFISHSIVSIRQYFYRYSLLLSLLAIVTNSYAQWQPATSNTTQDLLGVYYGAGQWVAVGENGTIVSSLDGISWTSQISPTTKKLRDVRYEASQWVAVGDNGIILTSPDAVSWTARMSVPDESLYTLRAICYNEGQWIASGIYNNQITNTVLTSTDGVNWVVKTLGITYSSLKVGNEKWVANLGTVVQTSTDGITWVTTLGQLSRGVYLYIGYSGGQWYVSDFYGNCYTSTDAVTWKKGYSIARPAIGFVYNNSKWVTIGSPSGDVYTSSDGIYWAVTYLSQPLLGLGYGMSKWVVVGAGGVILYNTNLIVTLPVSLVSFQGRSEETTAHLTWATAWEKGASHFLVERSRDAKSFEAVGRIEAKGTTNLNQYYTFLDKDLGSGLWYYRLRQVDLDGTFTHSPIIALHIGNEALNGLTLSPNPGSGLLMLEYKAGIRSVSVYSLTGGLVHEQFFNQPVEQWRWESQAQPAGVYLIRVQSPDGTMQTRRWSKQ